MKTVTVWTLRRQCGSILDSEEDLLVFTVRRTVGDYDPREDNNGQCLYLDTQSKRCL